MLKKKVFHVFWIFWNHLINIWLKTNFNHIILLNYIICIIRYNQHNTGHYHSQHNQGHYHRQHDQGHYYSRHNPRHYYNGHYHDHSYHGQPYHGHGYHDHDHYHSHDHNDHYYHRREYNPDWSVNCQMKIWFLCFFVFLLQISAQTSSCKTVKNWSWMFYVKWRLRRYFWKKKIEMFIII